MTLDNWLVIGILLTSLVLFVSERLRVDVVALLVLVALIFTNLVTIEEAFAGFASPAVVTVWAVFIISGALQRSGVADLMANGMLRLAGQSETRLLFWLMLTVGVMSAFMNNIGAVAILMPVVITIGRKMRIPSSRLLMPLAFAALLGGNMTLIGTPPNILAVSIMQERGIEAFAFFDFLPTGALALGVGMVYMLLAGRRLLPNRSEGEELSDQYHVKEFLTEARVGNSSPLIGGVIEAAKLGEKHDINVLYVRHAGDKPASTLEPQVIEAGDVLLLQGTPEDIVQLKRDYRLQSVDDWSAEKWHPETSADDFHLAEVTLAPNSRLADKTLRQIGFRQHYNLSVLAIRHHGEEQGDHLGDVPLRYGDSLLVQGPTERFEQLTNDPDLLVLERPPIALRRTRKAPLAIVILLTVLVSAALGLYHVAALMLAGALFMVLLGVITMEEAYRSIDWRSIFLIAGMLPLGTAMESTGTAALVANALVSVTGGWGTVAVLASVFVLTALLTEVISNAAATVLVVPIAIDVAFSLGVNPQPFVMATVLAASTSFLMPVGHQVNVLVFGPGGYRFTDYAKVGVGLNILMLLLAAFVVPLIWAF